MEKSKLIILAIGLLLIVGAIVALIALDSQDSTVLTIGKNKFDLADFERYGKVQYFEDKATATTTYDELMNDYEVVKIYNLWAEKNGITLTEEEMPAELTSGDYATLLKDYNLTSGDYMKVKKEIALKDKVRNDSYNLIKVPDTVNQEYISYLNQSANYLAGSYGIMLEGNDRVENYIRTVDYRVFEVMIPEATSGDLANISGDVSGDTSGDLADIQRDNTLNAKIKAQTLKDSLETVLNAEESSASSGNPLSGDSFSGDPINQFVLSQDEEFSSVSRFSLAGTMIANGSVESVGSLYLARVIYTVKSYLSLYEQFGLNYRSSSLLDYIGNTVNKMQKGEISDIYQTDDSWAFIYCQDVRDGFEGEYESTFNTESANCYLELFYERISNPIVAKKARFEELPGVKAKIAAAQTEATTSGDSSGVEIVDTSEGIQIVSGD